MLENSKKWATKWQIISISYPHCKKSCFRYNKQNKTHFVSRYGDLLSPRTTDIARGPAALGQYHLPSGLINHHIDLKNVCYSVIIIPQKRPSQSNCCN